MHPAGSSPFEACWGDTSFGSGQPMHGHAGAKSRRQTFPEWWGAATATGRWIGDRSPRPAEPATGTPFHGWRRRSYVRPGRSPARLEESALPLRAPAQSLGVSRFDNRGCRCAHLRIWTAMSTTLEQQWQRVATRHGAHLKPPERIDRGLGSSQDANIAKFCYINKQPIANRTQYADKVPKTTLNELLAASWAAILQFPRRW